MGAPVTLKNATDSYVSEKYPAKNYSSVSKIYLADNSAADTRYGYLYFGIPSGMAKTTLISAKLRLYSGTGFGGSVTASVHRLAAKFTGNRVNWNNKPAATGAAVSVTKTGAATGTMWEFDVTAMLQQVANGAAWYGFRLSATNSTAKWFYSAQASTASRRPTLVIEWSDAPDAPETLVPDNGDVISVAKPTLQWDFTDPSGDVTMAAFDLNLYSSEALALAGAAGDVLALTNRASSIPQLDLDDTAYGGLAADATLWWRVRVQDGAGLWSAWSDPASFQRKTKGTLTITNPAASPNNFVNDPTPAISWTFTGRTQRAYRVMISTPETPAVYVWDSGTVTSTDVSVTPPPGKITQNGKTYRLTVRIFDTEDRRAVADDPIYTEATRDFTFDLGATAPVTGFGGTISYYRPEIQLDWSRATAPDTFLIYRDGQVIEEAQPSELLVGGTNYRYVDGEAKPRKQHTWSVAAKVNGVVSGSNPTTTGTIKPLTTCLSELDGTKMIFLLNPNVAAQRAEESEIHNIIGDAPPVLITQSLRGYEGTVQGVLANDTIPTETAESQLAYLESFKDRPGTVLKLTWIDRVLRVVVRGVTDTPIANPDGTVEYLVKFDFFEVGF